MADPAVGRCSVCGRETWDAAMIGRVCYAFSLKHGARACPGIFIKVADWF